MGRWLRSLMVVTACGGVATALAAQSPAEAFQVGDRILLSVEGDSLLSDTFTVVAGPAVRLPVIGEISLEGVARPEIEAHLTRALGRYLKGPVVHARALIRLSILGEVARPGFYAVPSDVVLADALMVAGGPTQTARADKLRIERSGTRLWSGARLQEAIARGATVDELGLRGGDRIVVPGRGRDAESTVRIIGVLATVPVAVCLFTTAC